LFWIKSFDAGDWGQNHAIKLHGFRGKAIENPAGKA